MIDIGLSAILYTAVAVFYKLGSGKERNLLSVNLFVFLTGALTALILGCSLADLAIDRRTLILGAAAGLASVTANLAILRAVRTGSLSISYTIFNLALIVPVGISALAWREFFTPRTLAGLLLTICAVILVGRAGAADDERTVSPERRVWGGAWLWVMAAAFLANGTLMTLNKAFEKGGGSRLAYLAVYFGVGSVISAILQMVRRPPLSRSDLGLGAGIGAGSVCAALFLLRALGHSTAVVVFPSLSAATLILVAVIGVAAFRERMSGKGWLGVALGAAALALMS